MMADIPECTFNNEFLCGQMLCGRCYDVDSVLSCERSLPYPRLPFAVLPGSVNSMVPELEPGATEAERKAYWLGWNAAVVHLMQMIEGIKSSESTTQTSPSSKVYFKVLELPRFVADPEVARALVRGLGVIAGEWVVVDWRNTLRPGKGFLVVLERLLYERGAKVAHAHHPGVSKPTPNYSISQEE